MAKAKSHLRTVEKLWSHRSGTRVSHNNMRVPGGSRPHVFPLNVYDGNNQGPGTTKSLTVDRHGDVRPAVEVGRGLKTPACGRNFIS